MDSLKAFEMCIAANAAGNRQRAFDWDKAATLIKERGITHCMAGLSSDLEWTAGVILRDSQPVTDEYTYLSSNWATPVLVIGEEVDGEEIECWGYEDEIGANEHTKWPESALAILRGA